MENTLYANKGTDKKPDHRLSPEKEQFFREGYLEMYPDVAQSGTDPWDHYVSQGRKEGRDSGLHPGADRFFAAGYLEMYPDAALSGMDPWRHYVLIGKKEGRDSGLHPGAERFFADGYLTMYPDAAKSGMGPWHHYVLHGRKLGYDNGLHPGEDQFFAEGYAVMYPEAAEEGTDLWHHYASIGKKLGYDNGLHPDGSQFFAEGYTAMYQDVSESGLSPWEHYVRIGHKEGRDNGLNGCGNLFFSDGYLEMYHDVRESGEDAWHNYVTKGLAAGRDNGWHPDEGRFFAAGYLEMYPDVREIGEVAWHNYIREGKAKGRDNGWHPTRDLFLPDEYLELYPDVRESGENPWHHYVTKGKKEGRDSGHSLLVEEASEKRITEYWRCHSKSRKVIYTCMTGEYDHLVNYHYISDDYDYVCFTDNPALLRFKNYGVWQIRTLVFCSMDNSRNSRWHKLHPHELFPEYEESIWVDSNINILSDYIFRVTENSGKNFIVPKHFQHDCIYDEMKFIVQCHKDSAEHMDVLYRLYTEQKMPHHLGAPETNLLYRKHHDKTIIKAMHMWWNMIEKYSNRDQASFMYVMWKNHIDIQSGFIPNLRKNINFSFTNHSEFLNSYSLVQIEKYKKSIDEHKVILFDIFGTMLVMPYLDPSDLYLHLEKKEHRPGFYRARLHAEKNTRLAAQSSENITLDMIYDHIEDEFKSMQGSEEELLMQVCHPHPVVKSLYEHAISQKKQIVAVSDTYLSGAFLTKLLEKNGYDHVNRIVLSDQNLVGSACRQLYSAVLDKQKYVKSDVLHVGVASVSGSDNGEIFNIPRIVVEKLSSHLLRTNPRALAFSKGYTNRLESSSYLGLLAIENVASQEYFTRDEYYESLGYEYGGVAAYQFIKYVYEGCLKNGINDIAIIAGPGYTLQRVFDLFNMERLNAHCVSLPEILPGLISACECCKTGSGQADECARYFREALYGEKSALHRCSNAENIELMKCHKDEILELASRKTAEFLSYLEQFGYSSKKLAVVDFFASGFSLKNVFKKIYPDKEIYEFCWKSTATLYDKNAFVSEEASCDALKQQKFMEFLFSAPELSAENFAESTTAYKITNNTKEQSVLNNYSCVSDGIVRFVKDVKRIFGDTDLDFSRKIVPYLMQTFCMNLTKSDEKFMRNMLL